MTVQYNGGYFLLNEPLVRGYRHHSHTSSDLSNLSDYTVNAVNHIQDTPCAMNKFVLDTILELYESGEDLYVGEDCVLRVNEPVNPKRSWERMPKEAWDALDRVQKKEFRARRAAQMEKYEEQLGVYRATRRILETAREMRQFDEFYFPHNMDFRLRIYPIPTDLNPQSNDLSKGMIAFSVGTPLGQVGLYWMEVCLAGHWGEDKLSRKERIEYVNDPEFMEKVEAWVDDPVNNKGWMEADKPFQFLAIAHEWVWARRIGPEDFVSFLPGNQDGSCNGAQHLSIMARDLVGATATNCRDSEQREDLYMAVADRVYDRVQKDASNGIEVALEWAVKLQEPSARRKVVKRSVMTVPYGVTSYGVADFMIKDKHVSKEKEGYWDSAKYMRDLIMSSIDETLSNGRKLQLWFQTCGIICAKAGLPLVWDTPAGSKVTQAYRNLVMKRVRAYNTRFVVFEEQGEDEDDDSFRSRVWMDEKKSGTSAPPNVVHSCDAAHLQITVCRMYDAGIRNFSMVHDSFGCPFAQMGIMNDIIRETIVDMYREDYLQTFKESVERYSGLEMPEPPSLGEFDIEEILGSEFFFS